jgi:hypothetical protein
VNWFVCFLKVSELENQRLYRCYVHKVFSKSRSLTCYRDSALFPLLTKARIAPNLVIGKADSGSKKGGEFGVVIYLPYCVVLDIQ